MYGEDENGRESISLDLGNLPLPFIKVFHLDLGKVSLPLTKKNLLQSGTALMLSCCLGSGCGPASPSFSLCLSSLLMSRFIYFRFLLPTCPSDVGSRIGNRGRSCRSHVLLGMPGSVKTILNVSLLCFGCLRCLMSSRSVENPTLSRFEMHTRWLSGPGYTITHPSMNPFSRRPRAIQICHHQQRTSLKYIKVYPYPLKSTYLRSTIQNITLPRGRLHQHVRHPQSLPSHSHSWEIRCALSTQLFHLR